MKKSTLPYVKGTRIVNDKMPRPAYKNTIMRKSEKTSEPFSIRFSKLYE